MGAEAAPQQPRQPVGLLDRLRPGERRNDPSLGRAQQPLRPAERVLPPDRLETPPSNDRAGIGGAVPRGDARERAAAPSAASHPIGSNPRRRTRVSGSVMRSAAWTCENAKRPLSQSQPASTSG